MSVPKEWLRQRTTVAEVEAGFKPQQLSASWLEDWKALVATMQPGDELWSYCSPPDSWHQLAGRAGYAVVRQGEVIDVILTMMN